MPKDKKMIMRELRARRADAGLKQITIWVPATLEKKVRELIADFLTRNSENSRK